VLLRADDLLDWLDQKRAPSSREVVTMSITMRLRRRGGWEVDIRVVSPDGAWHARELCPIVAIDKLRQAGFESQTVTK
jgi:hypothetical protein